MIHIFCGVRTSSSATPAAQAIPSPSMISEMKCSQSGIKGKILSLLVVLPGSDGSGAEWFRIFAISALNSALLYAS
jgi:hypothetical protein